MINVFVDITAIVQINIRLLLVCDDQRPRNNILLDVGQEWSLAAEVMRTHWDEAPFAMPLHLTNHPASINKTPSDILPVTKFSFVNLNNRSWTKKKTRAGKKKRKYIGGGPLGGGVTKEDGLSTQQRAAPRSPSERMWGNRCDYVVPNCFIFIKVTKVKFWLYLPSKNCYTFF